MLKKLICTEASDPV